MSTVKELEAKGFSVKVRHFRNRRVTYQVPDVFRGMVAVLANVEFAQRGGSTAVTVTTPDGKVSASGYSECSKQDIFCKRTGREIAVKRAVAALQSAGTLV